MDTIEDRLQENSSVWLRCFSTRNGHNTQAYLQTRLLQMQVKIKLVGELPFQPDISSHEPGIIFFDQFTPELYDFIRAASHNGTRRVLAFAQSKTGLNGEWAWRLLEAGASDVLIWDDLPDPVGVILARLHRWGEVDALLERPEIKDGLIGESRAWKGLLRQVIEAARFTDSPILLMGETGTGKELVARLIHQLDPRRSQYSQQVVDCATIVPELSGSELFGHEKGAFTGAMSARDGAFALSDRGTLFLDEVGELPLSLQVQLLRVLQEHTYKRVGSNIWHKTDFRLICATNRDLQYEESLGRFRRDLYYRIATWAFKLPSLKERSEDILPLARYFMKQVCGEGDIPEIDDRVRDYLLTRDYPGNVRDLRNLIFRMMSRHVGQGPITIGDIPSDERPPVGQAQNWQDEKFDHSVRRAIFLGAGLRDLTNLIKKTAIRIAIESEDGNLQRAAIRLGVTDRVLQIWRADQVKTEKPADTG